jgi:hypothetical protein
MPGYLYVPAVGWITGVSNGAIMPWAQEDGQQVDKTIGLAGADSRIQRPEKKRSVISASS